MVHVLLPGIVHRAEQLSLGQQIVQHLHQLFCIAAGVVAHIENQLFRALPQQIVNGRDGFLGAPGVKILNGHEPDLVGQHPTAGHNRLHLPPLHGKRHPLPLPENRQRNTGAFFSPHQIPNIRGRHLPDVLTFHLDHQIVHLNACFPGRPTLIHGLDQKALLLLCLDGDADAHIGIVHLLLMGVVFAGGDIVAPPVAKGFDHGGRRGVLHGRLVGVSDESFQNQAFQLFQLGAGGIPRVADRRQSRHCSQHCHKDIAQGNQNFLFHGITTS